MRLGVAGFHRENLVECLEGVLGGFHVALHAGHVDHGRSVFWAERRSLLVVREGVRVLRLVEQDVTLVVPGLRKAGIELQRPVHGLETTLPPIRLIQRGGQVAPALGEHGLQLECALIGPGCFTRLFHEAQHVAEVVEDDGVAGIQPDGLPEMADGVLRSPRVLVSQANVRVRLRVAVVHRQRLLDERDRLLRPRRVDAEHAQEIERMDVAGIAVKDFPIDLLRPGEIPGLLRLVSRLQRADDRLQHGAYVTRFRRSALLGTERSQWEVTKKAPASGAFSSTTTGWPAARGQKFQATRRPMVRGFLKSATARPWLYWSPPICTSSSVTFLTKA